MMYAAWPDHGVPENEDQASLLAFMRLVDETNKDTSYQTNLHPDPPIMVNCSAGIGRTGSFIALCSLLRADGLLGPGCGSLTTPSPLPASPLGPLPDGLKDDLVAQEVDSLREQRPGMVQRDEQIMLIYEVLASAFP
jgi:protein-tyrosine phosphatase